MSTHGTPSFDPGQFSKLQSEIILQVPRAIAGVDPKIALNAIAGRGEQFALHIRRFFVPDKPDILRPRSIIRLSQVSVNYGRSWDDTLNAAGPNTDADWDIRKVGDLYLAERKTGTILTNMTLVNFGEDVSSDQVIEFGKDWNLGRVINPWECFAVSEHFPKLHTGLGFFDPMAVVSLKECTFKRGRSVCDVWFGGEKRGCDLSWFGDAWSPYCWFGFVSE